METHTMPVIVDGMPMDDARHMIYHEIQQCERHILSLRNQLNAYTPIATLPPEILLQIFTTLTEAGGQVDSMECIHVTHVCQRWRSISLDAPALWNKLSSNNLHWTMAMLERSKTAPLTVFMNPMSYGVAIPILTHLSRIRSLTINNWSAGELQKLHDFIEDNLITAPQLEGLSLTGRVKSSWSLPSTTFQQTDRLYDLFIHNVHTNWSHSSLFRNLTRLRAVTNVPGDQPTWRELITTLNQMPTLQYLLLDAMLPIVPFDATVDVVFAYMPNLEVVIFRDLPSMDAVVTFLNQVKLTPDLKIFNIVDLNGHPNGQEFRELYRAVNRSIPGLCSRARYMDILHHEGVGHPSRDKYLIDCFMTLPEGLYEEQGYAYYETNPPDIGLELPYSPEADMTVVVVNALDILNLSHITHLRIQDHIGHSELLALLQGLPELRVIRVYRRATDRKSVV